MAPLLAEDRGAALQVGINQASIVLPMFVVMVSVGIAIPACQFAMLQPFAGIAGTASGLFFFVQMALTTACGARPFVLLTVGASLGFALVCGCLRPRHARAGL